MIHFKSLTFLSLAGLLTFASCKKDDPVTTTPPVSNEPAAGTMTGKIDDRNWTSTSASASVLDGRISITGQAAPGGEGITLLLAATKGTYSLAPGSFHAGVYQKTTTGTGYMSQYTSEAGGTVTITEIDEANKTISGTFSMNVKNGMADDKVTITEGKFNKVKYVSTSGATQNAMSAKVRFADWTFSHLFATSMGKINIWGTSSNGSILGVTMPLDAAPGTYSAVSGDVYSAHLYSNEGYYFYAGDRASITITSNDTANRIVKGTFAFDGFTSDAGRSAEITEGSFDAKY